MTALNWPVTNDKESTSAIFSLHKWNYYLSFHNTNYAILSKSKITNAPVSCNFSLQVWLMYCHSQIRNAYFQGMNNHIISLFYGESIPSTTTGSQAFTHASWGLDASWWSEAGMLHNDVSCPQQHLLLCAYSKYCLVLAGSATSVFGSQGTNPL